MRYTTRWFAAAIASGASVVFPVGHRSAVHAQAARRSVLTQHNDRARSGVNGAETVLTRTALTDAVAAQTFGRLYSLPVDGQTYAQPLYVSGVQVGPRTRNLVFVATMHNNVYAFDADDQTRVWAHNFGCKVPFNVARLFWEHFGYNIHDAVGILGTPVVDDDGRFLYFVARIDRNATGQSADPDQAACTPGVTPDVRFVLHKVDVATGTDAAPPREIEAHFSPKTTLDPFLHLQRPGLLMSNGSVYVAFGGYQDTPPWHGWIFRFGAADLALQNTFSVTPTGKEGGIWQAGSGLAADASGDIYFMSGNGTTAPDDNPPNLATAFGQLTPDLQLRHYYSPGNHFWLSLFDLDLGSSGPVLLPDGGVVGGGKEGRLFLLGQPANAADRRLVLRADVQVTPKFGFPFIPPFSAHHIHGAPVVWNQTPERARIFVWGERDYLKRYTYVHTTTSAEISEHATSNLSAPRKGMPGGMLSLTVDGSRAETAVLWASLPLKDDAFVADVPGVLRAVDPDTLQQIWSNESEESYRFAKYCPPTVVDGKVFLATFSDRLDVYGIRPR
jgi:outer membrane protein assembly factor BamB